MVFRSWGKGSIGKLRWTFLGMGFGYSTRVCISPLHVAYARFAEAEGYSE